MFIDAHSHLDRYAEELEQSLDEINQNKIFTISNSMDLQSYERNLEIAAMSSFVLPTFGIHPWNAPEYANHLKDLDGAIAKSPILGEIGLDYFFVKDVSQYPAQKKVFEYFLNSANRLNKIVNLHTKGAEKDVLSMLQSCNNLFLSQGLLRSKIPYRKKYFRSLAERGGWDEENPSIFSCQVE